MAIFMPEIKWFYENDILQTTKQFSFWLDFQLEDMDSYLIIFQIKDFTKENAGFYHCVIAKPSGQEKLFSFKLNVSNHAGGRVIIMDFKAKSIMQPTFVWEKGNEIVVTEPDCFKVITNVAGIHEYCASEEILEPDAQNHGLKLKATFPVNVKDVTQIFVNPSSEDQEHHEIPPHVNQLEPKQKKDVTQIFVNPSSEDQEHHENPLHLDHLEQKQKKDATALYKHLRSPFFLTLHSLHQQQQTNAHPTIASSLESRQMAPKFTKRIRNVNANRKRKNNEKKVTTAAADGGGQSATVAPAPAGSRPSRSCDANLEVYNIKIQQNFDKKAVLPPVAVWERVIDQSSFRQATLRVCVRRRGLLFDRQLDSGFFTCILNRQGYLVIYTKPTGSGYAINLRKANKLLFELVPAVPMVSFGQNKASSGASATTAERNCNCHAKWRFGSVVFTLPTTKMAEWLRDIFDACCTRNSSLPPSIANTPSRNQSPMCRRSSQCLGRAVQLAPMQTESTQTVDEPEEEYPGETQQFSSLEDNLLEETQSLHTIPEESAYCEEGLPVSSKDQQQECVSAKPSAIGDNEDGNAVQFDTEQLKSASVVTLSDDTSKTDAIQKEVAAPTTTEVQQTATADSICEARQDQQVKDSEIEVVAIGQEADEDDKGQKNGEEEGQNQNPMPLKRKVTFSDLRTVIEIGGQQQDDQMKKGEDETRSAEGKEAVEEEVKLENRAQEEGNAVEEVELGSQAQEEVDMKEEVELECCLSPVMKLLSNAIIGEYDKPNGKEQVVGPALDQMRIVGQHATTDANNDDEDAEAEGEEPNGKPQFQSQAERFERTRRLFEPESGHN